jgi:hypothetical protein
MSDSRQLYDDDHNIDEIRRGMQSGLQRGIDNLFNRVRRLEIVDVKRKHDLEQHISADREHLLHNLSLSEDLRIWLETINARLSALENAIKLDDMLELANRVTLLEGKPATAQTKRQQVAEKFLAAAVGEFGYAACADWLYQSAPRVHSSDPDAHDRLVQMARLLEEAARDA